MNLRRRLIVAMALFLVIGLTVTDVVTYSAVRSYLYGRLDAQLSYAQHLASKYLITQHRGGTPPTKTLEKGLDNRVGPEVYVMVVAPGGRTIVTRPSGTPLDPDPAPVLPRSIRLARVVPRERGPHPYRPNPNDFNLSSTKGMLYRAAAMAVPQGTLVGAVPLSSTNLTLASLLRTELVVSLAVVLALCLLALWTVRRGLRPLDDMARTAGAIASGDLTRRVAAEDDVTEVGRLGTALNAMLAQIEAAFAEKSASEAKLRQFVADASHELRTPLTSIRGYAELLRKGAFVAPEDKERAMSRVEHEAARMGGLVDDLLLLARLDQGRPLQRGAVDLRRICQDVVDDVRLTDPGRPITLEAPDPVVVIGDRDRLVQVAHNLVGNALVHTPPGTPIRVEVVAGGPMGTLQVSDEGPGLTGVEVARAFDRFYRADHSRTGEGTGLGLSIVRAIAESLGGRAWARSSLGQGATFAVELPLAPRPPVPVGTDGRPATEGGTGRSPDGVGAGAVTSAPGRARRRGRRAPEEPRQRQPAARPAGAGGGAEDGAPVSGPAERPPGPVAGATVEPTPVRR